jgi:hypothetical protein
MRDLIRVDPQLATTRTAIVGENQRISGKHMVCVLAAGQGWECVEVVVSVAGDGEVPHPAVMVDRPVVIISRNPASKSIVLLPGSLGAYINRAQNGGSARGYPRISHIADHTARTRQSLIDRIFMHRHA